MNLVALFLFTASIGIPDSDSTGINLAFAAELRS